MGEVVSACLRALDEPLEIDPDRGVCLPLRESAQPWVCEGLSVLQKLLELLPPRRKQHVMSSRS